MKKKKVLKKKKVTCKHCSYKWATKSKLDFVVCPKCLLKVRIKEKK